MAAFLFREEHDGPTTRMLMILLATFANLSILLLIISEMTKTRYPAAWIVASGLPVLVLPALTLHTHQWVLPVCIAIGIVRFLGLWLNFQKAIVHYCGMRQVWSEPPGFSFLPSFLLVHVIFLILVPVLFLLFFHQNKKTKNKTFLQDSDVSSSMARGQAQHHPATCKDSVACRPDTGHI